MLGPVENQFRGLFLTTDFKSVARDIVWKKPTFFFGDRIKAGDDRMTEGVTRWVWEIYDQWYFLPARSRKYSIICLRDLALSKRNSWGLAIETSGVSTGGLGHGGTVPKHERSDWLAAWLPSCRTYWYRYCHSDKFVHQSFHKEGGELSV